MPCPIEAPSRDDHRVFRPHSQGVNAGIASPSKAANFEARTPNKSMRQRLAIASLNDYKLEVLRDMLAPAEDVNPQFQNTLRTRLNLPADFGRPPGTNAPAAPAAPKAPAAPAATPAPPPR